jgi:predicted HicB family RNase H-like nuclease
MMPTTQQHNPDKPITSNIRVPADLWERLRERAFSERTSVNALIVQAIAEKLDGYEELRKP